LGVTKQNQHKHRLARYHVGMNEEHLWQAWCDGCARPNPGHIGLGALLLEPDGSRHELSQRSPHSGCNNEAEARALLATLQLARTLQASALLIHCDSDVVVRLAQNASSTEAARLAPLFAEIRSQIKCFDQFELRWIPQHRNTEADYLSRSAFGLPTRTPAKPRKRK